nr:PA14 domain-containing protein [Bacteroidales bacterium]
GDRKYMAMFTAMYQKFLIREGQDWQWNAFNDDITWMVIACTRAYLLSGREVYLTKAKEQFDKMYARASTSDFEGGLIWKEGIMSKNACINGPAMVACCYLGQATGDQTYYTKAISLYEWSLKYLFNPSTGKVNDAYDGEVHTWSSTYNQGTYLGATVMLYNYTGDDNYLHAAQHIAKFTKEEMFHSNAINSEDGRDLEGFKGIFMRYARKYVVDCNRSDYIPWLQLNARVAYNNRNSENIIATIWTTRTEEGSTSSSFGASTALSLLVNCPMSLQLTHSAYQTIQSEDFTTFSRIVVEPCSDGTSNLGGIRQGAYSVYKNVDFGFFGASSADFRLSSAEDGGRIEIHLDALDGPIIGVVEALGTGDWANYDNFSCEVENVKGLHDIYLVYQGDGYLFNINYFTFNKAESVEMAHGLRARYYSGSDFNALALERIDTTIAFDWSDVSPMASLLADNYSVRWQGKIKAPHSGVFTFFINSDDGRKLWIDDQLIIDRWQAGSSTYSATISLEKDQLYTIKVEYFENVGNAHIQLDWMTSSIDRQCIPSSALFLPEIQTGLQTTSSSSLKQLKLFPNPTSLTLNVDCDLPQLGEINIYDLAGNKVNDASQSITHGKAIDVSYFSPGLYIVELKHENVLIASELFTKY